jgi:hypothetical protein
MTRDVPQEPLWGHDGFEELEPHQSQTGSSKVCSCFVQSNYSLRQRVKQVLPGDKHRNRMVPMLPSEQHRKLILSSNLKNPFKILLAPQRIITQILSPSQAHIFQSTSPFPIPSR